MKRVLMITTALFLASPVWAGEGYRQPTGAPMASAGAGANASAQSASRAQSRSTATGGSSRVTVNQQAGGGSGGGYNARGNTPDVFAPALAGGNPCGLGASGGVAAFGGAITGGNMREGQRCELRQAAALLYNMGYRDRAFAVACEDPWIANAMAKMNPPQPCPDDERRWRKEGWRP